MYHDSKHRTMLKAGWSYIQNQVISAIGTLQVSIFRLNNHIRPLLPFHLG